MSLRTRAIASAKATRARFENFQHWSGVAKARKTAYLANPTSLNRQSYLHAKKMRSIRLRTFRKSRILRNESKARLYAERKAAKMPLRLKALAEALKIEASNVHEQGGNNVGPDVSPLIREGGGIPGQAWCGWFCSVCYKRAGSKLITWQIGAVRLISAIPGVGVTMFARAGYLVRYTFDHVGIFICWCDASGNKTSRRKATHLKAVEGNTGSSGAVSDSAGGQYGVKIKIRPKELARDFINIPR